MNRIGTVVRTAQGLAIVRAADGDAPPAVGTAVIDEQLNDVGEIVDIFGPVESPYLAVNPTANRRLPELVQTVVYAR